MSLSAKYLAETLDKLQGLRFDEERLTLVFERQKNAGIINGIDQSILPVIETGSNEAEIDISAMPFRFFFDEGNFIARINHNSWDLPIFIYKKNAWYDPNNRVTEIAGAVSADYFLIANNHCYFDLLNFLKANEHKGDAIFYFVDYFSWDTGTVVFTTLKKEGQLQVLFQDSGLGLQDEIKLPQNLERLRTAFKDAGKQFPKFIKSELVIQLAKFDNIVRMRKLLEILGEIINVAEQSFEIYLHDLSLDNLKKDFIDYKNKYFNQLREILGKLTNQVIGLPVTIAASVFSTYKVADSPSTLLIILFVFLLYASYSIFLLKLQKEDIRDVREMFNKDFTYIEDSLFFKKFPEQLIDFTTAKTKINSRINNLITAVDIYYGLFTCSLLAFNLYVFIQLAICPAMAAIFLASILAICTLAYFKLIK